MPDASNARSYTEDDIDALILITEQEYNGILGALAEGKRKLEDAGRRLTNLRAAKQELFKS